ncbi:hypothetical protein DIURU_002091 [Diutina rugosa]|uniref:High osmolarity signaling protein SHO1 n=1 Tax=Diutina rugosa TaxID=5481 RepID=A0A642UTU0_DIURU|nr:uncharacterized protein DIURU_002091 [Diutina rugosa]KAA8904139.1 hypothetical protein DIURU_002091 [Diutina rugosa]
MGFKLSNFLADPFAVSTVSFGFLAWIVALVGAATSDQSKFPQFSWWGVMYEFAVVVVVFLLYLNNNIELYKFTLVGLVSVAFVYTTNTTNSLIYSGNGPNLACAVGCILLSILNVVWIVYFGGHPESPTNQLIDSFSLKNHATTLPPSDPSGPAVHAETKLAGGDEDDYDYKRYVSPVNLPNSQSTTHFQDNNLRQSQLTNKANQSATASGAPVQPAANQAGYMSSSQLNGLENFSSSDMNNRDLTNNTSSNKRTTGTTYGENTGTISSIPFRYKAKALYSYDANPDDINEISFVKDEILEVDDIDGKWWQARKANGQVGICPSNYVKLID